MKEILTDEKVAEIIKARYDSETPHILTEEEEKRAEEIRKELEEYRIKMNKEKEEHN